MSEEKEAEDEHAKEEAFDKEVNAVHKMHHDYGFECAPFWMALLNLTHRPCEHHEDPQSLGQALEYMREGACGDCKLKGIKQIANEFKGHLKAHGHMPVRTLEQPPAGSDTSILQNMVAKRQRPKLLN